MLAFRKRHGFGCAVFFCTDSVYTNKKVLHHRCRTFPINLIMNEEREHQIFKKTRESIGTSMTETSLKEHFEEIGVAELCGIFSHGGGRRNYTKSENIRATLECLKDKGGIYDFLEGDRNDQK